jgi:LmbE family N-acetylglucosaminyl deacetylase
MRILWIGAHPDDELFVAPYLGAMHEEQGATIGFFVATRGERGPCYLKGGCKPNLATVRTREMEKAAELFGGGVTFGDLPDGSGRTPEQVLKVWSRKKRRFLKAIEAFAPDQIMTLDPHHSGHPDDMAVGRIVTGFDLRVPIVLAESRPSWTYPMIITPAVENAEAFDARTHWHWLVLDLECHPSQMRRVMIEDFFAASDANRKVWLLPFQPHG